MSLAGKRVLVTRAGEQAGDLVLALRAMGADVVEVPTVGIAPPADDGAFRDAIGRLPEYDWLLLTSANAVRAVAAAAPSLPQGLRIGSAGPATTAALCGELPRAVLTAEAGEGFGAEGLARALTAFDVRGSRFLFPVSDRSPAALAAALAARGAKVDVVVAYRTVVPPGAADRLRAVLAVGVDAITLASPSAVEAFREGTGAFRVPAAVIGPTTAAAARAAGFATVVEAESATTAGLVEAVAKIAASPGK